MGCHPSHWRTHIFSRWLLRHQAVHLKQPWTAVSMLPDPLNSPKISRRLTGWSSWWCNPHCMEWHIWNLNDARKPPAMDACIIKIYIKLYKYVWCLSYCNLLYDMIGQHLPKKHIIHVRGNLSIRRSCLGLSWSANQLSRHESSWLATSYNNKLWNPYSSLK